MVETETLEYLVNNGLLEHRKLTFYDVYEKDGIDSFAIQLSSQKRNTYESLSRLLEYKAPMAAKVGFAPRSFNYIIIEGFPHLNPAVSFDLGLVEINSDNLDIQLENYKKTIDDILKNETLKSTSEIYGNFLNRKFGSQKSEKKFLVEIYGCSPEEKLLGSQQIKLYKFSEETMEEDIKNIKDHIRLANKYDTSVNLRIVYVLHGESFEHLEGRRFFSEKVKVVLE